MLKKCISVNKDGDWTTPTILVKKFLGAPVFDLGRMSLVAYRVLEISTCHPAAEFSDRHVHIKMVVFMLPAIYFCSPQ